MDVSWDSVTSTNDSEFGEGKDQPPTVPPPKPRGRPRKTSSKPNTPAVSRSSSPERETSLLAEDFLQQDKDLAAKLSTKTIIDNLDPGPFLRKPSGHAKKKSVTVDYETTTSNESGRQTLLSIYNSYFTDEHKKHKHNRPRRSFTSKNTCDDIKAEIDLVDMEVSNFKPGEKLAQTWAMFMGLVVEPGIGPIMGFKTAGLGKLCDVMVENPETQKHFEKLLIKYPMLRSWMEAGNWPELQIFLMMAGALKMVDDKNRGLGAPPPVPQNLSPEMREKLNQFRAQQEAEAK